MPPRSALSIFAPQKTTWNLKDPRTPREPLASFCQPFVLACGEMFALGIVIRRTGKSQRSQVFIMPKDAALRWPLEQCEKLEAIGLRALEKIITISALT